MPSVEVASLWAVGMPVRAPGLAGGAHWRRWAVSGGAAMARQCVCGAGGQAGATRLPPGVRRPGADCVQGGDQRRCSKGNGAGEWPAQIRSPSPIPTIRCCDGTPSVLSATSARGRTTHSGVSGPGPPSRTAGILLPRISTLVPALRSSGTLGVAVCALRIAVLRAEPQPAFGTGVKSQTKSQRSPAPGAIRPRPASITAGRGHIRRRPALSRDWGCAPYKRGAGGSNPPAPTGLCRSAASLNLARLISSG